MTSTLKTWLQGRPSLDATPSTPGKDPTPIELCRPSVARTHSFNDFSCSAADDAEQDFAAADRKRLSERFSTPVPSSTFHSQTGTGAAADWLQFRRPPLSRASCSGAASDPITIQPRRSIGASTAGDSSVQSDDSAPETPRVSSGWQPKADSIEHWEWSELIRGSSL
ncbi:hypothetical protein WJX74_001811 [Apatococcus lobatus]|uniref:Uncharacterized protein n=1 Tax=Apatococcus lobatus TaxID=904363 RepID=A0AAW1S321_9CHLO